MNKYNTDYHLEEVQVHGVSINPTAFLIVQSNIVKLLPVNHDNTLDKILDYVPDLIEKANCMMNKCIQNKKDLGDKIINTMKNKCDEKKNCGEEQTQESKNSDENNNENNDEDKNDNKDNEKTYSTNSIKEELELEDLDEIDELDEIDDDEQ